MPVSYKLTGPRTILLTIFYEALLIGFWFIDHAYVKPQIMGLSHFYSADKHYGGIAYL